MPSLILPGASAKTAPKADRSPSPGGNSFTGRDVAVLLGSALYLFLFYRHPSFNTDVGYLAAGADRIARGQVPFRDFFTELGPGTYYLQAGFFKLLGTTVAAVDAAVWSLMLGISWLIYRLAKPIIKGSLAVLPTFLLMAMNVPINSGLSHHWTGSFFFLLTLLCLARSVGSRGLRSERVEGGVWFLAGLLSVATVLCMQSTGIAAALLGVVFPPVAEKFCSGKGWLEALRSAWKRSACFLLGFAGAFVAALCFFAWQHAARDWLYDNFLFLVTNYYPYVNPGGSAWHALAHPIGVLFANVSLTTVLFAVGYYFYMAVGPVLVVGGSIWCVRALRPAESARGRLILLYCSASSLLFISELHSLDLMHFVIGGILIVPLLLSIGQILFDREPRARRALAAAAVVAGVFVLGGSAQQAVSELQRNTPVAARRGTVYVTPEEAGQLREWLNVVQSRVPAGDQTFYFPYQASLYFLTDTRNPTRYDYLLPAFDNPSQYDEVERTLVGDRPQFVFCFSPEDAPGPSGMPVPDPLRLFLRSRQSPYQFEQEVASVKIWTLRK